VKLFYEPIQDQLHVVLVPDTQSVESEEVAEGVVLDYDASGNVVAIEIEHAIQKLHLPAIARRDLIRALEASNLAELRTR
jgi:uncharacterized protein YuzE